MTKTDAVNVRIVRVYLVFSFKNAVMNEICISVPPLITNQV